MGAGSLTKKEEEEEEPQQGALAATVLAECATRFRRASARAETSAVSRTLREAEEAVVEEALAAIVPRASVTTTRRGTVPGVTDAGSSTSE